MRILSPRGGNLPLLRRPQFNLKSVPRDWYGGSPDITCFVNALHLFIPAGEAFLVRTISAASRTLTDPLLKEQIDRFLGQEITHSRVHLSCRSMQIDQGQEIGSWVAWYENLGVKMEAGRSLAMNLSITVALEHLLSALGEWILKPDHSFADLADPEMAALFRWHAAEEIEHKSIAFDVFQAFSGNLFIRWVGLLIAFGEIMSFWLSASWHLARQDSRITLLTVFHSCVKFPDIANLFPCLLRAIWLYLNPNFHPSQIENDQMAQEWLRKVNLELTS